MKLRTKFLWALVLISTALTTSVLLLVRQRFETQESERISAELRDSVAVFRSQDAERQMMLERSAALLATLPPLMAVMTSRDAVTIQDASRSFWELSGSDLFVLADRDGRLAALHGAIAGLQRTPTQEALNKSLLSGNNTDWWFVGGHLYHVFLETIYFGTGADNVPMGLLAMGFEVDAQRAQDVSRAAAGSVAFRYGDQLVVSTLPQQQSAQMMKEGLLAKTGTGKEIKSVFLDGERFLATTMYLPPVSSTPVSLTVLKSYGRATVFLQSLNQWILGVGLAAVLAGSLLVYFVAISFTQPLERLVRGVEALEKGDFSYPLQVKGNDEVSSLTRAFQRMRSQLEQSQRQLLVNERLATIGQMATSISHDLRHPLTAILAYAEFLAEPNLNEAQRRDFFQEIRIGVNRMTDELNSLLGFSKQQEAIRPVPANLREVVDRAVQTVRILPEFEEIEITHHCEVNQQATFDPAKIERVIVNLLFNACQAVSQQHGCIKLMSRAVDDGLEVTVTDNGPGIAPEIQESLFQPFVSHGKEKGIGLGLTVVQKIMRDHGGDVVLQSTGPAGTVFRLHWPSVAALPVKAVTPNVT
jgi:signal transduction histidine kinase